MNALAHALAHAVAHALPHGCFSGSVTRTVHAKRREGKGPSRPDHTGPEVVGETRHHGVRLVEGESRHEMMTLRAEAAS